MAYPVVKFDALDSHMKSKGYDIRNWYKNSSHFDKWCNKKGYGKTDPAGNGRGSSQIWYAEYKADPEGEIKCPPYIDFWHFVRDLAKKRKVRLIRVIDRMVPEKQIYTDQDRVAMVANLARATFTDPSLITYEFVQAAKDVVEDMIKRNEAMPEAIAEIVAAIHKEYGGPIIVRMPSRR